MQQYVQSRCMCALTMIGYQLPGRNSSRKWYACRRIDQHVGERPAASQAVDAVLTLQQQTA